MAWRAQSPLLFLDNVDLHAQPEIRRRVATTRPPYSVIEVRLDVYGYMRRDMREPAAAATRADRQGR